MNPTHTFAESGTYTVTLIVTDTRGVYSTVTSTVTVANVPPTATFTAPTSVIEGSPIALALTNATDLSTVDQASLTFAFACSATDGWHAAATPSYSCPTTDDATLEVRGKVTDHDGGATEYSQTVTVVDAPPTATIVAPATVIEGSPIAFSLTGVSDPSSVDQATLAFAYSCSATGAWQPATDASFSCPTTDNGTVTVRGRVSDKDGGVSEYAQAVDLAGGEPGLRYRYGVALFEASKFSAAADQFRKAVELDPYYAKPYFPLAYILEGSGEDADAIAAYEGFARRAPASDSARVTIARQRIAELRAMSAAPSAASTPAAPPPPTRPPTSR